MNLDQIKKLVGSLMIVGFDGPSLTASCKNYLEQWNLGGVILFKRNIESLEQVSELNRIILETSEQTPIISVDHEGGRVFRLPKPFTLFPAVGEIARDLAPSPQPSPPRGEGGSENSLYPRGRGGREKIFFQIGQAMALELIAAGFNLDYAPVLDINSNPQNPIIGDRAFGADPQTVIKAAIEFYQGLSAEGIQGCGKHFPGHGDTSEDSHLTLPEVLKTEEELRACELVPFQAAIKAGFPMLMTAHVRYPALDPNWPATLSKKILNDLLRQEMGYEGLIISDDFFMKGITDQWSLEEASERFLRAGGDLLLLCHQEAIQRRVSAHLVHVAEKNSGFRTILEAKSQKIAQFRQKLSRKNEPKLLAKYAKEHDKLVELLMA